MFSAQVAAANSNTVSDIGHAPGRSIGRSINAGSVGRRVGESPVLSTVLREHRTFPGVSTRQASYTACLAVTPEIREEAYRLRYRSYLAGGYIEENETGLFRDHYDTLDNADTIVLYDRGAPVASVRLCRLQRGTDYTSPAMTTFPDEVRAHLDAHPNDAFAGRGIEVTRLVRSPEAANNQGLVFLLYRMAGYIALCDHTQVMFACVRENHVPFYRRLGYTPASDYRPYPGLKCNMLLMASDRARYDRIRARMPIMDPLAGATHNLEGFFAGEPVLLDLAR